MNGAILAVKPRNSEPAPLADPRSVHLCVFVLDDALQQPRTRASGQTQRLPCALVCQPACLAASFPDATVTVFICRPAVILVCRGADPLGDDFRRPTRPLPTDRPGLARGQPAGDRSDKLIEGKVSAALRQTKTAGCSAEVRDIYTVRRPIFVNRAQLASNNLATCARECRGMCCI
jgi:hypothetical protein